MTNKEGTQPTLKYKDQDIKKTEVFQGAIDTKGEALIPWILKELFYYEGDLLVIFMGPPGAGKTTLIRQLTVWLQEYKKAQIAVGIQDKVKDIQVHHLPYDDVTARYQHAFSRFQHWIGKEKDTPVSKLDLSKDSQWPQFIRNRVSFFLFLLMKNYIIGLRKKNESDPTKQHIKMVEAPMQPFEPYIPDASKGEECIPVSKLRGAPDRCATTLDYLNDFLKEMGYFDEESELKQKVKVLVVAVFSDEEVQRAAARARDRMKELGRFFTHTKFTAIHVLFNSGVEVPPLDRIHLENFTGQYGYTTTELEEMCRKRSKEDVMMEIITTELRSFKIVLDIEDGQFTALEIIRMFLNMAPEAIIRKIHKFIDEEANKVIGNMENAGTFVPQVELPEITEILASSNRVEKSKLRTLARRAERAHIKFDAFGWSLNMARVIFNLYRDEDINVSFRDPH